MSSIRDLDDNMELLCKKDLKQQFEKYWKNKKYIDSLSFNEQIKYEKGMKKLTQEVKLKLINYSIAMVMGNWYIYSQVLVDKSKEIVIDNWKDIEKMAFIDDDMKSLDEELSQLFDEFTDFYVSYCQNHVYESTTRQLNNRA